jgi:hypothetical protein
MVRGLVLGALAFAAVFAVERQYVALGPDIKRYNAMREMSGDLPVFREIGKTIYGMIADFGVSRQGEARDLFAALTHDLVRYAAMRSM